MVVLTEQIEIPASYEKNEGGRQRQSPFFSL